MNQQIIEKVRKQQPLIHHITNKVVMNFTANGLISLGASPVMAIEPQEVADMASAADGLLLNIGTLTNLEYEAMIIAGKSASHKDIPIVLDPVGVSATPYRQKAVKDILNQVDVTAVKGNAGEMAYLAGIPWETRGVDSLGDGNADEIAEKVGQLYNTAAIVTGKTDTVYVNGQLAHNKTGDPYLERITGAGCLLGSILTAFLTTNDAIEDQILSTLAFYGLAAEYASVHPSVTGPGTFKAQFIDALSYDLSQLKEGVYDATK